MPVVRRQLLARRGRTLAGIAGIAAAILLILALKGIVAGMEQRLTTYIQRSGADVIVAQRGVDTMHMTQSAMTAATARAVASVPGVAAADPILFVSTTVERDGRRGLVYLIGESRPGAAQRLVLGSPPEPGEIVLDRAVAEQIGARLGSTVLVLGQRLRVSGEVEGTASIVSSVAFMTHGELARLLRSRGVESYVMVQTSPGVGASRLAGSINEAVPAVTANTSEAFAASERRVVGDMSTNIVRAMIFVGFVIGVAVTALVTYTLTLAQLRDYAVLRALGLRALRALGLVLAQVAVTVGAGFGLALGAVGVLSVTLPRLSPTVSLQVRPGDVVTSIVVAAAVAAAAAAVPVVQVARVDPASVFRK